MILHHMQEACGHSQFYLTVGPVVTCALLSIYLPRVFLIPLSASFILKLHPTEL